MSGAARLPGWQTATITSIVPRTPRLTSFFLRAPLEPHVAGQHVDVRLTADDGYQARRSYSIASLPGSGEIELAIERLDDGEVSPYFHDVAQVGDEIEVLGPIGGHFVWRAHDAGALLLIGGGSGVVPLISILRERAARHVDTPTLLLYSARTADELAYADELLRDEARDPSLRLRFVTTRGARLRSQDLEQRLDADSLARELGSWGHHAQRAYVCGATRFVEAMADGLVRAGVASEAIRTERYGGVG